MAHAITIRSNNFAEFAATHGTAVWHGLGQRLERGAPVEEWAVAAGLDWRVQRAKVRFAIAHGATPDAFAEYPGQVVLLRSDDKTPLGLASDSYKVHQPADILATLKNETTRAGFELETAGTLHGGRIIWALASDGQEAEIGKGDRILRRTLVKTHTDGSGATEGFKTDICVVCANTMRAALAGNTAAARMTHRSRYDSDAMARKLGLVHDEADEFAQMVATASRMADKAVSLAKAETLVYDLLKPTAKVVEVEKVTDSLAFKKILALFGGAGMGAKMDGRKGTLWGLLNAATEYADHHARATSTDNRVASAWFGAGDALKTKAQEQFAALV